MRVGGKLRNGIYFNKNKDIVYSLRKYREIEGIKDNALPGVIAQDITSWGEMKQVYRQLKKPEVKEKFSAVIVDTIDVAADFCKRYVCAQNDIESLGELGYGQGWTKFKDEFNEVFRGLTQLGYAVFFIGHNKEERLGEGDDAKTRIKPALSNSTQVVVAGLADIYGYAHQKYANEKSVLTVRCSDGSISCGSRFKYLPDEIVPMSYDNLIEKLSEAIDKEAAEHDNEFVTDDKMEAVKVTNYDFDALVNEFNELVGQMMNKNSSYYAPRITEIVEKYLGKNGKVAEANRKQAEFIFLINQDIKEALLKDE